MYIVHGFHFHRDGRIPTNLLYRSVEETLSGRTDAVMVVSGEDFDAASTGPIGRRTRVFRLPGAGVDIQAFSSAPPERSFPEDALVTLFCGELSRTKNPQAAVEAVLEARGRGRDVRLVVAGDGALRPDLDRYLGRSDAGDWLQHIPFSDRVPSLMQGADVLMSTSSREGLPRVLVEALAAGLPIVSIANRGSRELLAGGMGRLVPRSEPQELTDALVSFRRSDWPTHEEMLRKADDYSADRVADAYSAALAELFA